MREAQAKVEDESHALLCVSNLCSFSTLRSTLTPARALRAHGRQTAGTTNARSSTSRPTSGSTWRQTATSCTGPTRSLPFVPLPLKPPPPLLTHHVSQERIVLTRPCAGEPTQARKAVLLQRLDELDRERADKQRAMLGSLDKLGAYPALGIAVQRLATWDRRQR